MNTNPMWASAQHPLTVLDHARAMLFTHSHMTVASTWMRSYQQNGKPALVSRCKCTHSSLCFYKQTVTPQAREMLLHTSLWSPSSCFTKNQFVLLRNTLLLPRATVDVWIWLSSGGFGLLSNWKDTFPPNAASLHPSIQWANHPAQPNVLFP